jgi:hypothetical protein
MFAVKSSRSIRFKCSASASESGGISSLNFQIGLLLMASFIAGLCFVGSKDEVYRCFHPASLKRPADK